MIIGNNVRLRAIEREDIPRFVRWMNDPDVIAYLLMNSPLSKAMEEQWFEHQLSTPPHLGQILAIEVFENNKWVHIGNTGLHNIETVHSSAEFGIVIGEKEYWNKGYGREAIRLILQHGFDNLNLHRIYLHVFENNPRGIRVYETVGFKREGVLRDDVYKNGRYLNVFIMSILRSEWKENN